LFLFPQWSSYFIAGAMFFLIHREGPSGYKLFMVGACYILSVAYAIKLLPLGSGWLEASFSAPVIACFLAVAYGMFLVIALRPRTDGGSNPFFILGLITYPLYLLHQDIGFILLRSAPASFNRGLLLSAVIVVIIGLSWVVHIGPEKWLASRLKLLLAAPSQNLAASLRAFVSERFAGLSLKSTIPTRSVPSAIPATISTIRPSPQGVQTSTHEK
jgi:peptidoglycan/LPS O-acetylase OafA/YrhL